MPRNFKSLTCVNSFNLYGGPPGECYHYHHHRFTAKRLTKSSRDSYISCVLEFQGLLLGSPGEAVMLGTLELNNKLEHVSSECAPPLLSSFTPSASVTVFALLHVFDQVMPLLSSHSKAHNCKRKVWWILTNVCTCKPKSQSSYRILPSP